MIVHNGHTARERHRVIRAMRGAGAVSAERARSLEQLGLHDSRVFRSYRDRDIVREAKSGSFYLDEEALREFQRMLWRWLLVPVMTIMALVVYAIVRSFH